MPTKGNQVDALVDTSVAVAVVIEDHEHHHSTLDALRNRHVGLAGHAAFETFSVLTRLPPPARRSPQTVERLLRANFVLETFLSSSGSSALLSTFAALGISGGSVYDALVGAAAVESGLVLLTRDTRAIPVYRSLKVEIEVLRD